MATEEKLIDPDEQWLLDAVELTQKRLIELRNSLDLSQDLAGETTGTHSRTIYNYEKKTDPLGKEIRKVVKGYNTTFAYLAGEIDDPAPDALTRKPTLLSEQSLELLKLTHEEFVAATNARKAADAVLDSSKKEYEAARRYRKQFERIHQIDTGFDEEES